MVYYIRWEKWRYGWDIKWPSSISIIVRRRCWRRRDEYRCEVSRLRHNTRFKAILGEGYLDKYNLVGSTRFYYNREDGQSLRSSFCCRCGGGDRGELGRS